MATTKRDNLEDSGILVISPDKPLKANCWSCGAMRAAHFCRQCGRVQPPVPVDYFTFFGLPCKLNIDTRQLEHDFYDLSRHLHPDINAAGSGNEQEWSLQQSSQLNDAYRTLKDPIARTEYLLRLQGVQLEEQSQAATEEARRTGGVKKQQVPPDLLEEVFELNMQLEELRMNKKMGESDRNLENEVQATRKNLLAKNGNLLEELRSSWNDWDALINRAERGENVLESDKTKARNRMMDVLNRRSYIRNLLREVDEVLEG
jgi:molecular chaperone HscB